MKAAAVDLDAVQDRRESPQADWDSWCDQQDRTWDGQVRDYDTEV